MSDQSNAAVAFAIVCGAGASTALGGSLVFFPCLVKLASRRVLAVSLGFSAGVMIYISLTEIFEESVVYFHEAGHTDFFAYLYGTLSFFGGVLFMIIMGIFVNFCSGGAGHGHHHEPADFEAKCEGFVRDDSDPSPEQPQQEQPLPRPSDVAPCARGVGDCEEQKEDLSVVPESYEWTPDGTGTVTENRTRSDQASKLTEEGTRSGQPSKRLTVEEYLCVAVMKNQDLPDDFSFEGNVVTPVVGLDCSTALIAALEAYERGVEISSTAENEENGKLSKTGINTAFAIALHNFPEGLATFVAAMGDPRVGAVLAVAVAIHNIPEGLCVAMPIYFATGNRWKAFFWALLSGLSEPLAALIGWAAMMNYEGGDLYGILMGLSAGMMVLISTKEIIPTAHKFDTADSVVSYAFIAGMFVIALSLVLFTSSAQIDAESGNELRSRARSLRT